MSKYSIRDIEELSGIKAHTLRIWEQRYKIVEPQRTDTNIRYYNDEQLKLILNISLLNRNGMRISQIATMSEEERQRRIAEIDDKEIQYENQIKSLTFSMIDIREDVFEKIVNTSILQIGFEMTMIRIVYPFLERVGTLWRSGAITPAQEHFISNLIRQKMVVAIDGQTAPVLKEKPKFLLFTPEGDFHELSLLFMHYLLRSRGIASIYLGANVPFQDLEDIIETHNPDHIFMVMMVKPNRISVEAYLKQFEDKYSDKRVLITGQKALEKPEKIPGFIETIHSFEQSLEIVSSLH